MKDLINPDFKTACKDYFYLLTQGYPESGSLKLVGDRYKLSRDQRSVLYRGIASGKKSAVRKVRLIQAEDNMHLLIDGYNVLFTILNYRLGRAVFISTDGIIRDAGSLHGKLRNADVFRECINDLLLILAGIKPSQVDLYLDSPVSASQMHCHKIQMKFDDCKLNGKCHLSHSADQEIISFNQGVLASSDTELIEMTTVPVTDLARLVLIKKYNAEFFNLQEFLLFA